MVTIVWEQDISTAEEDIIVHQVNCKGIMGSGVALSIRNNFPLNYILYKEMVAKQPDKQKLLGETLFTFENGKLIANIFGQFSYGRNRSIVYTDYEALQKGFEIVAKEAKRLNQRIAIPYYIGCGLGNGDWGVVRKMIESTFEEGQYSFYYLAPTSTEKAN